MRFLTPKIRLSILLLGALAAWQFARTAHRDKVLASNSGIYLTSSERMVPHYVGEDTVVQAMDQASALSLVAEDVDGDGVRDVVAGYRTAAGFALGFYRGNLDAVAPQSADSFNGIARNRFPSPFVREVTVSAAPIQPDFLAAGSLGSSDHDIVVGARGGTSLSILSLDGGKLQSMQSIALPGALTSLAALRIDRRQPYSQLLAGIQTDQGAKLLIFSGSADGLVLIQTRSMPRAASQISFADLDGDGIADAAVLAGGGLFLLAGQEVLDAVDSPNGSSLGLKPVSTAFTVSAVALGSFVFDRGGRNQIAMLSDEGTLHIYAWSGIDSTAFTAGELQAKRANTSGTASAASKLDSIVWNEIEGYKAFTTVDLAAPPVLFQTRISGYAADDVMALDSRTGRLSVLTHPNRGADGKLPPGIVLSRQDTLEGTVTALAARVNIDGRPGVVLIKKDSPALSTMMPLPDPTFTVNTTLDTVTAGACGAATPGACSLREAIIEANTTPGVDTILLPAGTYTLTRTGANENAALTGDLDILDGLNIVGAVDGLGRPASIIQAGASAGSGIDKVLSINPNVVSGTGLAFDTQLSNLEIRYGKNPSILSGDGYGGGFDWDASGTGTLSLTNCYIHDNSTSDGPGGGISLRWTPPGTGVVTISSSLVQNNVSQRTGVGVSGGGGIFLGPQARLVMTNTSVSGNQASGATGNGGGLLFQGPAGSLAIHGGAISSNQAGLNGGGVYTEAGLTIDQGTVIGNNTAGASGGGIWSNLLSDTTTLSKVTITGNSAVSTGGGIQVDNNLTGNTLVITFSRLAGNSAGIGTNLYKVAGTVNAIDNWWGTNAPAGTIGGGAVAFDPYILLTNTASPSGLTSGASSTITASFIQDNHGTPIPPGNLNVLIGLPTTGAIFPDMPVYGTLSFVQNTIQPNGQATETYTATGSGTETIHAVVDSESVPVNISVLGPPSISKAFGAGTIGLNGVTSLSFLITNPNNIAINGINFNDVLPLGLVVATPNGVSGACGAGVIAATANANNLALTGGTLPANTSCSFSVNVRGTSDGVQNNVTGNVTSNNAGTGGTASASVTVITPPSISKTFGAASVPQSGSTLLSFTINNPNVNSTFNGLGFTDAFPAGLVVATPNALTNTCGGTASAPAGSGSFTLSGGTLAPGASCTISANMAGTTIGGKNNGVTVNSTNGGPGNTSNASTTIVGSATLTKTFGAASIPLSGSTSLTFNLTNPNAGTTLTGINFADTLPAGLAISTPNGVSGSCGGGSITANAGGPSVSLAGATLVAGASCSFVVNVTGTAGGAQNNTTGPVTSVEGGTGAPASASLVVVAPPSLTKSFGAVNIPLNGATTLSFTLTNPAANTVSQTGVAFTDNLPAGIVVSTPNDLTGSCGGGTITAAAGSSTVSLSGAVLAINTSCAFSVSVTGASVGAFTNTTGPVTSTNGGTGATSTANLNVAAPPTISKIFGSAILPLNSSTSLSFTVTNPAANPISLTGVAFTDSLPAGLVVSTPSGLTGSCAGGTIAAGSGTQSVSLSGASLAPNTSCSFGVNVTAVFAGTKNNAVTATSAEAGAGNTSNASITVVAPPVLNKTFGAPTVPLNGTTTLTFNIVNPNPTVGLTGVGFSDLLPSGLAVSTPNGLIGSCAGGTITAAEGGSSVTLTSAALIPSGTCTFAIDVKGTTAGDQMNTTSNVTSVEGGIGGTATASLAVVAPPSLAKAFGASTIQVNGITTLSFTLVNPAVNTVALSGVAFTDTLPAGLLVATPNGLTGTCGVGTIAAAGGSSTITLSGGSLPINSSCTFSVNVSASQAGSFTNTTGQVTSTNGGTGSPATAILGVASPPTTAASFGAALIPLNGSTTLSISITNPAANTISLTGVAFTDLLPAGIVIASPNGLAGACGGGAVTAASGGSSIGLSAGTLAAESTCTLTVNVTGVTPGVKNNSVSATSNEGGTGNTANSSLTVAAPAQLSKTFGAASVPLNGSTTLSFTVSNPNPTVGLTGISFGDTLPTGLSIATPNGLTGSCAAGTITVGGGGNVVSLSNAALPAAGSCTFSINITGTAVGAQNNTTSVVTSAEGGTGGAASASLTVVAPPSIVKVFGVANIPLNGSAVLTFTITNPAANIVSLAGVAVTDTLPAGLVVSTPSGLSGSCGSGTVSAAAESSVIALSGGTIPVNTACTFSVNVKGAVSGMFTNLTGTVTSTNGGAGNTATANLGVASPPVISSSFNAAVAPLNGGAGLDFTITNPAANSISLTGVDFTDNLPAGLVVASPNGLTGSCGSGTITAVSGSTSISLSNGTIAPNSSCTLHLNVAAVTAGVKNNSVTVTSLEGGAGNTSNSTITVAAPAVLAISFGSTSVALNGTTTLTFNLMNPNATVGLTGVGFSDVLPSGLVISTPNGQTGSCGAGTITAAGGDTSIILSSAALMAGGSCTFAVNVTGTAAGDRSNVTSVVTSVPGGTGGTASASLAVVAPPSIVTVFGAGNIPLNGTTSLSFTITNPVINTVALTGVAFSDALPPGLVVDTPNGSVGACGGGTVTAVAGSSSVSLTNGALPINGSCTISVNVKSTASGLFTNTTGAVSSTNGGSGNTSSATLGVATPPVITKSFGAAAVPLNGPTTLSFTIVNPAANTLPLTGVAFTDLFPTGLVVASPNGLTGSCGSGTIAASPNSGSVSLTGGVVPAHGDCTISVLVTGISAGVKNNSVTVDSIEGGPGNTSNASLRVVGPPTIGKSFGASGIPLGGITALTFNIANPNSANSLSSVGFLDTLPAGLAISTPNGLAGTCASGTVTAAAGSNSIALAGATLGASSSCSLTLNVTGTSPGVQNNTTGPVTSSEGGSGGAASATVTVVGPPTLVKGFGTPSMPSGGSTTLSFAVTNLNSTVALTGISFVDNLPSGLSIATPNGMTEGGCGGAAAAVAGSSVVSLSGGVLAPGTSCTFNVDVTGASPGARVNTTSNITSNEGGIGGSATATLQVTVPVTLNTSPPGLMFTADGTTYNGSQTLQWIVGSAHTLSTATTQPGTPGTQYVFANWSDSGAATHTVTAPTTATTYTATFGTQFQLTTTSNPANGGTIAPPSGAFVDAGQTVTLTASPSAGYQFASWTGSIQSSNGATAVVLIDAPKTIVANFSQTGSSGASISVDPPTATIQYQQGVGPSSVTRTFLVTSNTSASFSVTAADSWITVAGGAGTTPASVVVTFNLAGFDPGTYTSTLSFVGPGGTVVVPIAVQVIGAPVLIAQPGALNFAAPLGSTASQSQDVLLTTKNRSTTFTVVANAPWLSVTATGSATPATLHVQASPAGLPQGTYQGSLTVTSPDASNSPFTISVTLTVGSLARPTPLIAGVSNGASFQTGPVASNTILSLFGSNFCSSPQVPINGLATEILAALGTQINIAVPGNMSTVGAADLIVVCDGQSSAATTLSLAASFPAVFTISQSGSGQGSILNQDLSVNGPGAPLSRNRYASIYVTGFGPLNAPSSDGLKRLALTVTAFVGNVECLVSYAGEAPGYTSGLQQINILVPNGVATGSNVPIRLIVNGVATQNGVTMAVQ